MGIDISEKMLEVAKRENSDDRITYLNMAMEDIGQLDMVLFVTLPASNYPKILQIKRRYSLNYSDALYIRLF